MAKRTIKQIMFILVVLVVALYCVSGTYARYAGTASGVGEVQVAKWHIEVGGVHNNQKMTIEFKQVENDHVVDGKIAPNTEMYADILIDPTDTEVSIDYWFTLGAITGTEGEAKPQDMSVTKVCYLEDGHDGETLLKKGDKYTGSILLKNGATKAFTKDDQVTVRVYAKWVNNDDHNVNDSEIARKTLEQETPKYKVEVTAHCEQHIEV